MVTISTYTISIPLVQYVVTIISICILGGGTSGSAIECGGVRGMISEARGVWPQASEALTVILYTPQLMRKSAEILVLFTFLSITSVSISGHPCPISKDSILSHIITIWAVPYVYSMYNTVAFRMLYWNGNDILRCY